MNEFLRKAALGVQSLFDGFDTSIADVDVAILEDRLQPIFILGAPRTGSTLLYQLLVQQLQVSYISNLMAAFPRHMVKLLRAMPRYTARPPHELHRGYHGFVPGLAAPSEAGKIMDRWFGSEAFDSNLASIRRTLAAISATCEAPFIIKSLTHGTRLTQVHHAFPSARFVQIQRDPLFVAQSIYLTRQSLGVTAGGWWSVEVPGFRDVVERSLAYQAVWQVLMLERMLADQFARLDREPIRVGYAALCAHPRRMVEEVGQALALPWRDRSPEAPSSLVAADEIRVDRGTWQELEVAYRELSADIGGAERQPA